MSQQRLRPHTASDLLALLNVAQDDLGKGGRRLANFFIANLNVTALMSSSEVAQRCGVHASSVIRLAQSLGFSGYREFQSVLQQHLSESLAETKLVDVEAPAQRANPNALRLHFIADSGRSFNESGQAACNLFCAQNPSVEITSEIYTSYMVDPNDVAQRIKATALESDGLILVSREHPAINDAVRLVTGRGIPVICLTTDLPSSGRTAYVGSDQYVSGATAGWLCGRMLPRGEPGRVLFVYSVPFRCHQDREQGFRQVLRSEFPTLAIDERVSSDESIEVIYEAVRRYIAKNGPPAAIYNVSGANLGVGRALEDEKISDRTLFIGHELNVNSRSLLERGIMDLAIGHDFHREIALSVECIKMARRGVQPVNHITQSQLFTRYNCAIF